MKRLIYIGESTHFRSIICWLYLLLVLNNPVWTQSNNGQFTRLQPIDGLSEGVVHSILKDSRGFMWFCTADGLNRYDGYKIKIYKKGLNNSNNLTGNQILSIVEDKDGYLWIGTSTGLNKFDPETEEFTQFHNYGHSQYEGSNSISSIYILDNSHLLIGTFADVYSFNRNNGKFYPLKIDTTIIPQAINKFYKIDDNSIFIAAGNGLYIYDIQSKTILNPGNNNALKKMYGKNIWSVIKYREEYLAINADGYFKVNLKKNKSEFVKIDLFNNKEDFQIREVLADSKNNLWFGTNNGLLKFNSTEKKYYIYQHNPFVEKSLSSDRVSKIIEDDAGLLWIATFGGGINKLNLYPKGFKNFSISNFTNTANENNRKYLLLNFIMHIYGDSNDNLYISSLDKGFSIYNKRNSIFYDYTPFLKNMKSSAGTFFYFAFPYDKNNFIINDQTNFYSYSITENHQLKLNYKFNMPLNISSMVRDSDGIFWCGNYLGIQKFRESEEGNTFIDTSFYRTDVQTNFILDQDSILWIGAKGLIKFSKKEKTFRRYFPSEYFRNKTMSDVIYYVHDDKNGILWLGTFGDGLLKFNIQKNNFEIYTTKDGLPDNTIYAILQDGNGNLWLSTNRGISNYDISKNRFINYDRSDGLLNMEFNRTACYKDKKGIMYFGGVDGVDYFHPDNIKQNQKIPPIVLTDFKVNNKSYYSAKEYSFIKEIILSYDQNFFSFEFASLDLTNPSSNKYLYKLEGVDNIWIESGNDRVANYTHISPGEYIFRVKGSNNDGIWNEKGLTILIVITPPFWETWWFRLLFSICIIISVFYFFNRKTNKLIKEKEAQERFSQNLIQSVEDERKRIARELHDGLGQNLLIIKNKAYNANLEPDKGNVREEIVSIESLAMNSLSEIREIAYNLHPHQIERLGISKALEIMAQQLNDTSSINFNCHIDNIDNLIAKDLEINVYRIIQESISNIIKHSNSQNASVIVIKGESKIKINIEDDGNGFDVNEKLEKRSLGIASIYERSKILKGEVLIKSNHDSGTIIQIDIPIKGL